MIELCSIALTLFGTVLLAVSLNHLLSAITLAATAHDVSIKALTNPTGDLVVFTGLDKHLVNGARSARRRTIVGILMIGAASILQAIAIIRAT